MSFDNLNIEKKTMKCPNPKCGIELQSTFHTVCPLCAEPFPIRMLPKDIQKKQHGKLLLLILLLLGFIALVGYLLLK